MADTLAVVQPITKTKTFSAATIAAVDAAVNAFITGTLDVDADHVYTTQLTIGYFDPVAVEHVRSIAYTYIVPYPPAV